MQEHGSAWVGSGHGTAGTPGHGGARIQGCRDTGAPGDRGVPGWGGRAGHPPPDQNFLLCPEEEAEGWRLSRCWCPSHRVACSHYVTAEHVDRLCRFLGAIGPSIPKSWYLSRGVGGRVRSEGEEVSLLTEGHEGLYRRVEANRPYEESPRWGSLPIQGRTPSVPYGGQGRLSVLSPASESPQGKGWDGISAPPSGRMRGRPPQPKREAQLLRGQGSLYWEVKHASEGRRGKGETPGPIPTRGGFNKEGDGCPPRFQTRDGTPGTCPTRKALPALPSRADT